ncbi:CaiB/BaiF CoA transferase family protein [Taklimakanibacter deserti]|uniref:CaiB/BaiF CoA transferase family protein n=1 Tax=Taklimakanibacter deserti TaxID=2267839 RepID=UPI000E65B061
MQTSVSPPLRGVTVLDLSRVLAGPYCTMLLAELGARVIKVEQPGTGDDARAYGPFVKGKSAYFTSINRGKESIALDLKDPADAAVLALLIGKVDVLVENFRPGTMEKLGFGVERIRDLNPAIVYASASGFGQTGPHSPRPAYDMVVQGLSGMMSVTGHPNGEPARVGVSIGDLGAGLYTAIAINAALYRRARTGEGARIDVAMFDCQVALLENAVVRYLTTSEIPHALGSRHSSIAPFQSFRAGDGQLIIAAGNDDLFVKLCDVMEVSHLSGDPRFATNALRCQHVAELQCTMEAVLGRHPVSRWLERLDKAGIPAGPINRIDAVLDHPQISARNMLVTVDDSRMGPIRVVGNPIKFDGVVDPPTRTAAPEIDQHREAVLREFGVLGRELLTAAT